MIVTTKAQWKKLIPRIAATKVLTIDAETTGLKPWEGDEMIGIGLALDDGDTFYLPFRHETEKTLDLKLLPELWRSINKAESLVGHNLKFDISFLNQDGFEVRYDQKLEDMMAAARLCEPDRFANLDLTSLLEKYLGVQYAAYDKQFIAAIKALKLSKKSMIKVPIDLSGPYCEEDVRGTRALRIALLRTLNATEQMGVWNQEIDVTSALWEMERVGVGFNLEYGHEVLPLLQKKIGLLHGEIYQLAGQDFNVNSPLQLSKVMQNLGLKSTKKGKTGPSWDKEVLEELQHVHPMPAKILELRAIQKIEGTDIRPRLERGNPTIHEPLKSFGAITGRMSSALHTLPREGIEIEDQIVAPRSLIAAREGYHLYLADYSQMEMRVFADYVGDKDLIALLETGEFDFHSWVAKAVWRVDESHPEWSEYRRRAKAINFGLIYGIGKKRLAHNMGVDLESAIQYRADYFIRMPKAEQFIETVKNVAEARGYVRNRFWRRYWIEDHRVYVAVNYLVQGTSADIMKNRMVAIARYIETNGLKSRMVLQVHDELIFEVHVSEEEFFPKAVKDLMEERLIGTYLAVDMSKGNPSWGKKTKLAWCEPLGNFHPQAEHEERCLVAA